LKVNLFALALIRTQSFVVKYNNRFLAMGLVRAHASAGESAPLGSNASI
jgi:hypothetical protein